MLSDKMSYDAVFHTYSCGLVCDGGIGEAVGDS
jgi:hypothetical protein